MARVAVQTRKGKARAQAGHWPSTRFPPMIRVTGRASDRNPVTVIIGVLRWAGSLVTDGGPGQ